MPNFFDKRTLDTRTSNTYSAKTICKCRALYYNYRNHQGYRDPVLQYMKLAMHSGYLNPEQACEVDSLILKIEKESPKTA